MLRRILHISLLHLTLLSVQAMNIDMGIYKLDENELQTKSRYIYSDFKENKSEPLKSAEAKFDIGVYQQNYDQMKNDSGQFGGDAYIRMYVIMSTDKEL